MISSRERTKNRVRVWAVARSLHLARSYIVTARSYIVNSCRMLFSFVLWGHHFFVVIIVVFGNDSVNLIGVLRHEPPLELLLDRHLLLYLLALLIEHHAIDHVDRANSSAI